MSRQARRWVVCVVWVAVGLLLIWRGLPYAGLRDSGTAAPDFDPLTGNERWIALAAALVLGLGKGFTALRKGARRAATQIERRGERAPVWTVFSPFMILLVGLMIGAGLALRLTPYDPNVKGWLIGILYPAIGLALIIGGLLALTAQPLPDKR
jgi:hypothetical protein